MTKSALGVSFVLGILLFLLCVTFPQLASPALMQGPIVLDGVAGAGEWDPSWQVSTDPLDVFLTDTGLHPHDAPTYARSGYDAIGLWAHYDDATTTWYFRLDVDGRVADSDSQTGTSGNLGVGTHGADMGPLVVMPFQDSAGIGPSEVYRLLFQYQSDGPFSAAELGGDSTILPGVVVSTTAGLAGQGVYSTTFNPGILEWAFARDVIFPAGSSYDELRLAAHAGDDNDRVSDDAVRSSLISALDQSVACPESPVFRGSQATFTTVYTIPSAAAMGVSDVTLMVDVPGGTSFVSAGSGGSESSGTITWSLGDLSPGATGQVTFTLQIGSATPALTLDSEIACVEGLRDQASAGCSVQDLYRVYLPIVRRDDEGAGMPGE
jgi:hypothetical protein